MRFYVVGRFLLFIALCFQGIAGEVVQARAAALPAARDGALILPFHLKDGFILIDDQVDGTPGVFIFDTGMPFRFLLNRHYVPLGKGMDVKRGTVASGQAMVIVAHEGEKTIKLAGGAVFSAANGARYTSPETVLSADFSFIEKAVTPRFLGFIGWELMKNYVFVIDYDRHAVPLYPLKSDGTSLAPPAKESALAAVIDFGPSSPPEPFALDVGGVILPSALDTGGHERLAATPDIWARLTAKGAQVRERGGDATVDIRSARYRQYSFDLPRMEKVTSEKTLVTLGYPFLRHYRSTWNISRSTVTLERK
jgi:hypothetical protein